jgi:hypothetical protein
MNHLATLARKEKVFSAEDLLEIGKHGFEFHAKASFSPEANLTNLTSL